MPERAVVGFDVNGFIQGIEKLDRIIGYIRDYFKTPPSEFTKDKDHTGKLSIVPARFLTKLENRKTSDHPLKGYINSLEHFSAFLKYIKQNLSTDDERNILRIIKELSWEVLPSEEKGRLEWAYLHFHTLYNMYVRKYLNIEAIQNIHPDIYNNFIKPLAKICEEEKISNRLRRYRQRNIVNNNKAATKEFSNFLKESLPNYDLVVLGGHQLGGRTIDQDTLFSSVSLSILLALKAALSEYKTKFLLYIKPSSLRETEAKDVARNIVQDLADAISKQHFDEIYPTPKEVKESIKNAFLSSRLVVYSDRDLPKKIKEILFGEKGTKRFPVRQEKGLNQESITLGKVLFLSVDTFDFYSSFGLSNEDLFELRQLGIEYEHKYFDHHDFFLVGEHYLSEFLQKGYEGYSRENLPSITNFKKFVENRGFLFNTLSTGVCLNLLISEVKKDFEEFSEENLTEEQKILLEAAELATILANSSDTVAHKSTFYLAILHRYLDEKFKEIKSPINLDKDWFTNLVINNVKEKLARTARSGYLREIQGKDEVSGVTEGTLTQVINTLRVYQGALVNLRVSYRDISNLLDDLIPSDIVEEPTFDLNLFGRSKRGLRKSDAIFAFRDLLEAEINDTEEVIQTLYKLGPILMEKSLLYLSFFGGSATEFDEFFDTAIRRGIVTLMREKLKTIQPDLNLKSQWDFYNSIAASITSENVTPYRNPNIPVLDLYVLYFPVTVTLEARITGRVGYSRGVETRDLTILSVLGGGKDFKKLLTEWMDSVYIEPEELRKKAMQKVDYYLQNTIKEFIYPAILYYLVDSPKEPTVTFPLFHSVFLPDYKVKTTFTLYFTKLSARLDTPDEAVNLELIRRSHKPTATVTFPVLIPLLLTPNIRKDASVIAGLVSKLSNLFYSPRIVEAHGGYRLIVRADSNSADNILFFRLGEIVVSYKYSPDENYYGFKLYGYLRDKSGGFTTLEFPSGKDELFPKAKPANVGRAAVQFAMKILSDFTTQLISDYETPYKKFILLDAKVLYNIVQMESTLGSGFIRYNGLEDYIASTALNAIIASLLRLKGELFPIREGELLLSETPVTPQTQPSPLPLTLF